jgi:hypothetical protein
MGKIELKIDGLGQRPSERVVAGAASERKHAAQYWN